MKSFYSIHHLFKDDVYDMLNGEDEDDGARGIPLLSHVGWIQTHQPNQKMLVFYF